jgi:hypothetical protein
MSLILSPTTHVRAGAGQRTNRITAGLLASACFAATNLVLAAGAGASDYTLGGGAPVAINPAFDPFLTTGIVNVDEVVNINANQNSAVTVNTLNGAVNTVNVAAGSTITSPIWGTYQLNNLSNTTLVLDGTIIAAGNGATLDTAFFLNNNTVTVSGAGSIQAGGFGVWARGDAGAITINGITGGITSGSTGILVQSFNGIDFPGTLALLPTAAINIGQTTPIGNIVAGGDGISVVTTANLAGDAPINITTQNVTAGGVGISTVGFAAPTSITAPGAISGTTGILSKSTTGAIVVDGLGTGTLTGTAVDGATLTTQGDATVQNYATVEGLRNGIYVLGSAGTTNIQGNGPITGTTLNGIVVGPSSGNVNIGTVATNGVVTAAANGIWVNNTGAGNNTIVQNNNVTGGNGFFGILTGTATGTTSIIATAATQGGTAINAISTTGAIILEGQSSGTLTGTTVDGALVQTQGNATVQNFETVTGNRNGIYVLGSAGTTSIQGNGLVGGITGTVLNGIVVGPSTGDVNIGTVATNGVITGGVNGIWVNNTGAGNTDIVVDQDVTGSLSGGWGILSTTVNGNNTVTVNAGTVTGNAALEVTTVGSGNVLTTIAADAIVDGTTWGYVTTTISGTGVANNSGLIKTTADTGAADLAGSGLAVYAKAGDNTVNNLAGGEITGGITTAGIAFTLNNEAGGVWTPSLANSFGAITDTVNNAGLINIRTGTTVFAGLETLTNLAGGVIDLTYGGTQSTNSLVVGGTFAPLAGSTIIQAFNPALANNSSFGTDSSSNAKGTADTILASAVAPGAKSTINLKTVGGAAAVNGLIGTSGSVALVQGTTFLLDPGKGASAKFVNSAFYTLVGDPSTGAVKFNLTDAADGGVFLQWSPNITAASLGAFGSAVGASSNRALSKGTALALASGGLNGVGGFGNSGGPTGGGAAGQVADLAAGGVMSLDSLGSANSGGGGSLKDGGYSGPACPSDGRGSAWAAGDVSSSNSTGGGDGRSNNLAGGVEANVGDAADLGCRRLAVGVFGFTGDSTNSWSTGRDKSSNDGIGAYLRASSAMGLYGSLLGAVSWSDHDLSNLVFNSTANKNATGISGVATIGYVARVGGNASVDLRTYVAYGNVDGDGFTDSQGITVSGSNDDLLTVGASAGVYAPIAPSTQGFVRGGVKWAQVDSSITAFGITQSGTVDEVSGSVESGFVAHTSDGVELGASGFGEFSDSTTSYGGRAHVGVKF